MRALAIAVLSLVIATACTSSDPVTAVPTSAPTVEPTAAPTATVPSALPTSQASPTASVVATPAPAETARPTSEPTVTATPAQPPEVRPGDAGGVPFSTVDVRTAVEEGRGYSFWLLDDREPVCSASAVPEHPYWSANLMGSDFGPVLLLWVYPDIDALRADWDVEAGEAPVPRFDCELPSGFVYWNNNLILAFDVWLSVGEELPLSGHHESPTDMPATQAFLALTP